MKQHLYLALAAAGLFFSASSNARPLHHPAAPTTETPAAAERKAAAAERKAAAATHTASRKTAAFSLARKSSVSKAHRTTFRGMAPNKSFTTPQQLRRQLHLHQNHLKHRAQQEARSRRARCIRQLN